MFGIPMVSLIFLKRSLVFPILLFSLISLHWSLRVLISPCYSVELCIQMGISFLFSFAFRFASFLSYFLRLPQTTILPFCISFSWGWSWSLPPVQCHSSSGNLSIRPNPWIYFSVPLYNHKGFDLYHTWMV